MKKINSLTSIAKLAKRTESPVRSPLRASFSRSQSISTFSQTQSTTTTISAEKPEAVKEVQGDSINIQTSVTSHQQIPHHDDSHAGPYGVETPLEWEFHVTVSKVPAGSEEEGEGKAQKPRAAGGKESR